MGKSVLADQARMLGIPVHDADRVVHDLMQPTGEAYAAVCQDFPDCLVNGVIDRKILGRIVFFDTEKRKRLEGIIHPLVRARAARFIRLCRKARHPVCILDIPLLFELGRDRDMDHTLCVSAPRFVQKRRVVARPHMTEEKFAAIVRTQMPDLKKRLRSDHVILSCRGKRHTLGQLKKLKELYA